MSGNVLKILFFYMKLILIKKKKKNFSLIMRSYNIRYISSILSTHVTAGRGANEQPHGPTTERPGSLSVLTPVLTREGGRFFAFSIPRFFILYFFFLEPGRPTTRVACSIPSREMLTRVNKVNIERK